MSVHKTITLTEAQNEWVQAQVESGQYADDNALFGDLIDRAQLGDLDIDYVRDALIEGEASGFSEKSPEDIRQTVRQRI